MDLRALIETANKAIASATDSAVAAKDAAVESVAGAMAPKVTVINQSARVIPSATLGLSASALGAYLPLAGGTMTGVIVLDGVRYHVTLVNDANYTTTPNDQIIIYTALTGIRTITAGDTATNLTGQQLLVLDGTPSGSPSATAYVQFAVKGGSGDTIRPTNTVTAGRVLTVPGGVGMIISAGAGIWVVLPSALVVDEFALGNTINAAVQVNWQDRQTFGPNAFGTRPSIVCNGNFAWGANNQTLAATLALTDKSPTMQTLIASGSDQIVDMTAVDSGAWFIIANGGATNNIIVQNSGVTQYIVPPGQTIGFYVGGNNTPRFTLLWTTLDTESSDVDTVATTTISPLSGTVLVDIGTGQRSGQVTVNLPRGTIFSAAQIAANALLVAQSGQPAPGKSADDCEHVQILCTGQMLSRNSFRIRWLAVGQAFAKGMYRLVFSTIGA